MVNTDNIVEWGVFPFFTLGLMIKNKFIRALAFLPIMIIQVFWLAAVGIPLTILLLFIEFLEA